MFRMFALWQKTFGSKRATADGLKSLEQSSLTLEKMEAFSESAKKALGRSLHIRHLDVGSNNAEEAELIALSNPIYDITRFGFEFTASPRHADILAITGPVTRHLKIAMEKTYQATPAPKIIVAVGDAACYGAPYQKTYACLGQVDQFLPVDVYIPGSPPSPEALLSGLLKCQDLLLSRL